MSGHEVLARRAEEAAPVAGAGSARTRETGAASRLLDYQRLAGNHAVQALIERPVQREAAAVVQPPDYIVPFTFIGRMCIGRSGPATFNRGINATLKARLEKVEDHLKSRFASLPQEEKTRPRSGEPAANHVEWLGIEEAHIGWRSMAGHHGSGSAIDIAISTNPYIATRTGATYGGEAAAAGLQKQRADAVAVYDRALMFTRLAPGDPEKADVSNRANMQGPDRETTAQVFARFKAVSNALPRYFSLAFHNPDSSRIDRPPPANLDKITDDELYKRIPATERKEIDGAVLDIRAFIANDVFAATHPDGPFVGQERDIFYRMLRDYEMVRIPMVYGAPSATPGSTRNPLQGFLNLREELVVAMTDVGGLRWGASDFGAESGDMQHFDLGFDANPVT